MNKLTQKLSWFLAVMLSVVLIFISMPTFAYADTETDNGTTQEQITSTEWYTLSYEDNTISLMFPASLSSFSNISKNQIVALKDELISYLKQVVYDNLFPEETTAQSQESATPQKAKARRAAAASEETTESEGNGSADDYSEILGNVSADTLGKLQQYVNKYKEDYSPSELITSYVDGELDFVIKVAIDILAEDENYSDEIYEKIENKIVTVVTEVIMEEYAVDEDNMTDEEIQEILEIREQLLTKTEEKTSELVVTVQEANENGESISIDYNELYNSLTRISVNGYEIYNTADGDFNVANIKSLIRETMPTSLTEIASYSDDEMSRTFVISVDSKFGKLNFNAKVGLSGDCSQIRNACKKIAKYLDVKRNGTSFTVNVTLPDRLFNAIINRADREWENVFNDVDEVNDILENIEVKSDGTVYISDMDADDVYTLLNNINYDKLYELACKKYPELKKDGAYEKVLKYIQRALNFFDNTVYPSNKIQNYIEDKSMLDFYTEDGAFNLTLNNVALDGDKILSYITDTNLYSQLSEKLATAVETVVSKLDAQVSLNLTVELPQMSRVRYYIGTDLIEQALVSNGTSVDTFELVDETNRYTIHGWRDANGNIVTTIDGDTDVYAIVEFTVDVTDDINVVYNPATFYIMEVTCDPEEGTEGLYQYQWYKDGTAIVGATRSTYVVEDVADSGTYYCIVTDTAFNYSLTSDEITVAIAQAEVEIPADLAYETATYDGTAQTPTLTTANKDFLNLVTYAYTSGKQTDAKVYTNYTVTFALVDTANYTLKDTTYTADWEITPATITVSIAWNATTFTYDGKAHAVEATVSATTTVNDVDVSKLYTYAQNGDFTATNAGKYTAALAEFASTDSNYVLELEENAVTSLAWAIDTATITVTNLALETSSFTYSGKTNEVKVIVTATTSVEGVEAEKLVTYKTTEASVTSAINAGEYSLTLEEFASSNTNYTVVLGKDVATTLAWNIAKYQIDANLFTLETTSFVYDGTNIANALTLLYNGEDAEKYVFVGNDDYYDIFNGIIMGTRTENGDNSFYCINVQNYYVVYSFDIINDNYELINTEYTESEENWPAIHCAFTITPATITVTGITWDTTTKVYKGEAQTITATFNASTTVKNVTEETLLTYFKASYEGNTETNVKTEGNYTATITDFTSTSNNYVVVLSEDVTNTSQEWNIVPATVKVTGVEWNYDNDNKTVYDGKAHTITATFTVDGKALPTYFAPEYSGNTATDVSKTGYTATVTGFTSTNDNYVAVLSESAEASISWNLAPYIIDADKFTLSVSSVTFNNKAVSFTVLFKGVAIEEATINNEVLFGEILRDDIIGDGLYYIFSTEDMVSEIKDAGSYTVFLPLGLKSGNYQLIHLDNPVDEAILYIDLPLEVIPAVITISAEWSQTKFVYDGTEKVVTIKDYSFTLNSNEELTAERIAAIRDTITYEVVDNKGTYGGTTGYAEATFTTSDPNYVTAEQTIGTSWSIAQSEVDVSDYIHNSYTNTFTYNGEAKVFALGSVDEKLVVTYQYKNAAGDAVTADQLINAGTYTAYVASIELAEDYATDYTIIGNLVLVQHEFTFVIQKAQIDVSSYQWNYTKNFVYSGSEYKVELAYYDAAFKQPTYTNNTATNAGAYTASATLELKDTANYEVVGTVANCPWTISKAVIDASTFEWSFTKNFVYDGNEHAVTLVEKIDDNVLIDRNLINVVYSAYTNSAVGSYTATATITLTSAAETNYALKDAVNGAVVLTTPWTISKAVIDVSNYSWNYTEALTYNGGEKTVTLVYVDPRLTATYSGNTAIEVGEYTATVVLSFVNQADSNYLTIVGLDKISTLRWSIAEASRIPDTDSTFTNTELGITVVDNAGNVLTGLKMFASDNTEEVKNVDLSSVAGTGSTATVLKCFEISFGDENRNIREIRSGYFTVTIAIPEEYRNISNLRIAYISPDYSTSTDMAAIREGDNLTFTTSHFSLYALVEVEPAEQTISAWVWVLVAIILLLLVALTILIILRMKQNDEDDDNTTPDGSNGDGDDSGTKTPVPDPAPVYDVEPAEPVTIAVMPDTKVVATVQTLPVVMEAEEEAPAEEDDLSVEPNNSRTVYNRSFSAKMMQAEDDIQEYYSEIKNELLSYKGVKARMSWAFESFNKGRNHVAKITVRGKTLTLYLALDPNKYNASRYHHKDASDTARYQTVPFMLKIKSDRAAKYAKELIAEVMKKLEVEKIDGTKTDYTMDRKPVVALIEDGYIKIKEVEMPDFDQINSAKKSD